jgi:uncharacterized protein with beta-barrel porin domain
MRPLARGPIRDSSSGLCLAFASTGIGFTVFGVPLAEDSALIDAGLDFNLAPNVTVGVSYSGQFGDGVADNAVKGASPGCSDPIPVPLCQ